MDDDLCGRATSGKEGAVKADAAAGDVCGGEIIGQGRDKRLRQGLEILGQAPARPGRINRTETVEVSLVEDKVVEVDTEDLLAFGAEVQVEVPPVHILVGVRCAVEEGDRRVVATGRPDFPIDTGCRGKDIRSREDFDQGW